jgi:hypothetical protein
MTMELFLNLAWAVSSLALIWIWARGSTRDRVPRSMQFLALAMTLLLLLPVISLSDDLQAMQGPSETDTCLRRVLHSDETHPVTFPASPGFPVQIVDALTEISFIQEVHVVDRPNPTARLWTHSLDSRPPPRG